MGKEAQQLKELYPDFRVTLEAILADLRWYCRKHCPEIKWRITEGFRSTKRQQELFKIGRVPGDGRRRVTNVDGITVRSRHQDALAVDLAPIARGRAVYNDPAVPWEYLGHLCRKHGVVWGGSWARLQDKPHIEWPTKDRDTTKRAKAWLKEQNLDG